LRSAAADFLPQEWEARNHTVTDLARCFAPDGLPLLQKRRHALAEIRLNAAERLFQDPTFRLISSEKIWDRDVALTSRLQSFETEILAEGANFAGLAESHLTLRLFGSMLRRMEALPLPAG
jgi:hypothetical protein